LTAFGYALVGVPAYLAFPTKVQSNVFNTFDQNEPVMQFARGVVGLLQIASYPVNHFPARAAIGDIVGTLVGQQPSGYAFVYVETLLFFGLNLLIAMYVTDLGAVFEVIGGTCGSIIILGMPSLLLLNHSLKKVRNNKRARGYLVLLEFWDFWAGIGLLFFSLGLFVYTVLAAFAK
jgi:amino acid permease